MMLNNIVVKSKDVLEEIRKEELKAIRREKKILLKYCIEILEGVNNFIYVRAFPMDKKDLGMIKGILRNGAADIYDYVNRGFSLITDEGIARRFYTGKELERRLICLINGTSRTDYFKLQIEMLNKAFEYLVFKFIYENAYSDLYIAKVYYYNDTYANEKIRIEIFNEDRIIVERQYYKADVENIRELVDQLCKENYIFYNVYIQEESKWTY